MLKRLLEHFLLLSRWLLAPLFVMEMLGLIGLNVMAARRLWNASWRTASGSGNEAQMTLELLNLVDLTLTGALVVIVTLSIYENFVSPVRSVGRWPEWMGTLDFSELKLRVLTTIVAISAIKLLEVFMDVPHTDDRDIYFYCGIHLTLVISTVAFALSEKLSVPNEKERARPKGEG